MSVLVNNAEIAEVGAGTNLSDLPTLPAKMFDPRALSRESRCKHDLAGNFVLTRIWLSDAKQLSTSCV